MTFTLNENSWNKKASVLYLEMPLGTGFSYGGSSKIDHITDDTFTTEFMYVIRMFFERFPAYKKCDFYLSGHGYGAVHVAYIAKQIIE